MKFGNTKIGGMSFGSTKIGGAKYGNTLVFSLGEGGGGDGGNIPAGYTELQYVTTDSNAYIDTGIAGSTDLEITIDFSVENYIQYGAVYGNWIDDRHRSHRVILNSNVSLLVAGGNNSAQTVNSFSISSRHILSVSSNYAILDGVSTQITATSFAGNTNNICLGNRSLTNPTTRDIGLRIYAFRITRSGVAILDYVPCYRDSDQKPGFYDKVNFVFIPSSTTTDFVAGPLA